MRLPFGLICAQNVFQRKVDETFCDLAGVTGIADDIVVYGYKSDFSDHDENLLAVLQHAQETQAYTSTWINTSSGAPSMVQFLSRFVPNLATAAADLWGLTKKTSEFIWSPEHQSAVEWVKQLITAPTALQYFDSAQPLTIQVDASQSGLGAVLLEANGPVGFASKLLSETESQYSNIRREMLAVLFGLEKSHYYAYGRPVVVKSNHKPLVATYKVHGKRTIPHRHDDAVHTEVRCTN